MNEGGDKLLEYSFPLIYAGEQLEIEVTVVLENTPANMPGTVFTNTAKWSFGRLIDGVFYEPLPGEWGVSEPMSIVGPDLVVTKTSDETALNLGTQATFTLDVQNTGGSDAWHATIQDEIPDGMCEYDPTAAPGVSAQVFAADGVTPVSGVLEEGTDYTVTYTAAPTCRLQLNMESNDAVIGPSERLIIAYRSQLDTGTTTDGLTLTNVAGATQWFSSDGTYPPTKYTHTVTDGTPAVVDFQDSETVTTALAGYYFQKTVENLTTGANPATTAAPGDRLRYRLRLFNVDETIQDITVRDPLDPNSFDLTTFTMLLPPTGAGYSFNSGTGLLTVSGDPDPLGVAVGSEIVIEFEITLRAAFDDDVTAVDNQAVLTATGITAESDDPYVNGVAPPGDPADPTTVRILSPGPLSKATTRSAATIGEQFSYRVTIPAARVDVPLYDVRILDDLGLSAADLRFVHATVFSGGTWTLSNTGTATAPVIEDTTTGIDIPAGGQAVIDVTVELLNTVTNTDGLVFSNSASFTYNRTNGVGSTQTTGGLGSSGSMTVVEPDLTTAKAVGYVLPAGKQSTDSAMVGDILEYTVTVSNVGDATAYDTGIADTLPSNLSLVAASATAEIDGASVSGFVPDPTLQPDGSLAWGHQNGDVTLDIPAGGVLVLTYRAAVDSITGTEIENSVYVNWTSLDGAAASERTGADCPDADALNDYCDGPASASVGTLDETAITKAVVDDSYAETPASTAEPIVRVGDTVTYELTLNVQEYTTRNVVVEDTLPAGMALESFTISDGASFSYTLAVQPSAGDTGTLQWVFGDITNPPSNDQTPVDALVIQYVARVVTDSPPVGVAYDATIHRDNLATLSYSGGNPAADPDRLTASETIDVRQPQMSAISKVDLGSGRTGSGTQADPYQVDLGSDVMQFRLSSCNEGLAPAYGVVISDQLAPQFDEADLAASHPIVSIGTTTLSEGTDYTYTAPGPGGEMRIALSDSAPVNPGECVTVEYSIGFHTDLTVSTSWSNKARLPEYWSLPTSEPGRIYEPDHLAQVWMTNLVNDEQLLKALASSSEATIGDEVIYRITVPAAPMNAAINDVVVTDNLHDSLEYTGASAVDGSGSVVTLTDNSVAPGHVSLEVANIPAGQQVIISLTARVLNNDVANAGLSFTNTAEYTYTEMPDGVDTASTSAPLTIVEPAITLAKSVTNVSDPGQAPTAGDILRYRLDISADGGGTGDNFSDAFDLHIEDTMSTGMVYLGGTATVNGAGNTIAEPSITGDGSTTGQTLIWSPADVTADIDVAEGTVVTVTYDVQVLDDVQPGQDLTNSVMVQWTGQDGDNAYERTGTGSPVENDYVAGPVTFTVTARFAISFVKSVVNATTGENPGANAIPGDTLHYTLVVTNESIVPLVNPSVVDELAAQFVPGSLQLVSVSDPGANTTNCSATGGANGTGIIDIRNLTLGVLGNPDDTVTIEFEATLAPVIQDGTAVLNQAELAADNPASATSNETATLIHSAPAFEVLKTSRDMTGDSSQLMPGDTLRYTITLENIGDENAINVRLQDDTPANCSYVAGSTTLNGVALTDPGSGESPLHAGILVNTPENTTAGNMPADAMTGAGLATVTFDVVVDPDAMEGLIIENQGFVTGSGAGSGARPEQPSDDPDTPTVDDPTRDIVGNLPLLYAQKTVRILPDGDSGSPDIVDPGDVLEYTIVISNFGSIPATGVVLSDNVPTKTTYVEDTLTLNEVPVGHDGGVSPLIAGLPVNSDDNPGDGMISAGGSAVITFEVRVDDSVSAGTIISNQGSVLSSELPAALTDADGLPSNGFQPTVVVVGDAQLLEVTKEVGIAGGGNAEAGSELVYTIRVTNIGSVPAAPVVVTDDLGSQPLRDQITYVGGSGTMNGSPVGVTYSDGILTADYAVQYGALQPGDAIVVRFRVQIDAALAIGTTITNTGVVSWNDPVQSDSASVSIDVGGTPGSFSFNGYVWHDANLDKLLDTETEASLEGWSVALYRNSEFVTTELTDADGAYRFTGLLPNEGAVDTYEIRFLAAGATSNTPSLGWGDSPFTNGPQRISEISGASGAVLQDLNLPLWPNGIVYDSVVREPVAGASLTLLNSATGGALPAGCFDDPAQQNQVTALDGFYKFDLNFSDAACPAGGAYLIEVTPPETGYMEMPSQVIPPASDATTEPFSVPDCPGNGDDAIASTDQYCEVLSDTGVPPLSVPPRSDGTRYYLHLLLDNGLVPGHSQVFNNPIPVDPELDGAVSITKTSSMVNVARGDLVPYTITVSNNYGVPLYDMGILDRIPAGFKYMAGSARLDGEPVEPNVNGRDLLWDGIELGVNSEHTLRLLLVVGAGVSEGKFVNRAQAVNTILDTAVSEEATATVLVVPDPDFDCTDVIGKVFDDRNLNGRQDEGEDGLPGVRAVTAQGLIATSDEYGRFHITCAAVPDEDRGSNFILKLDERSLPSGYRLTTENPRVQRATRGKMLRFNFGAAIHRVVRLDIADGVFEPDTSDLRLQWASKIDELVEELKKGPSILRLSYLGDVEGEGLVERRLEALKKEISRQWESSAGGYRLTIETGIYWRRGAPVADRR